MKKIIFLTVIVLFISVTSVTSFASDKVTGELIYKKNCAGCHGRTGEGNGPAAAMLKPKPANFIASDYKDSIGKNLKGYSETELADMIKYGRKGTAMPQWNRLLSHEDISDVLSYIRSLGHN